jgi:hypothetical protein
MFVSAAFVVAVLLSISATIYFIYGRKTPDPFEVLKAPPNLSALGNAQSKIYDIGPSAVPRLEEELGSMTNSTMRSVVYSLISSLDAKKYCQIVMKECQSSTPDFCSILRGADVKNILQISDKPLLREMTNTLFKSMSRFKSDTGEHNCIRSFFEHSAAYDSLGIVQTNR